MGKFNQQKPRYSLIYNSLLKGICQVREYGIAKYGNSEDWRSTPSIMHYNAALRHIRALFENEEFDNESELPHLFHAASNLMFLIEERYGNTKTSDFIKINKSILKMGKNERIINH